MFTQINFFIRSYFGLGIAFAIALAFFFPYTALQLYPLTSVFLFSLMFVAGVQIDWASFTDLRKQARAIIYGNIIIFVVIPILVFTLAQSLLSNDQYIMGAVFSALTPAALVAPFFTKLLKGNGQLALNILISSMILAPFITPFALTFLVGDQLPNSTLLLLRDMLFLTTLPLLLARVIKTKIRLLDTMITRNAPLLNLLFLSLLIFILFGSSLHKITFGYDGFSDLVILLFISFIQNFFLIFAWRWYAPKFLNYSDQIAIILSGSMKNIAIAAGLLLLYDPVAAIAPAIGFIAHIFLFTPKIMSKLIPVQRVSLDH